MRQLQASTDPVYEPGAGGYTNYIGGGYHQADPTPDSGDGLGVDPEARRLIRDLQVQVETTPQVDPEARRTIADLQAMIETAATVDAAARRMLADLQVQVECQPQPPYPLLARASGPLHRAGLVPDPGSTAGTAKFLREDMTFVAPASGGIDYSTSEQLTGRKWVDGKSIYEKTIFIAALSAGSSTTVAHGISGLTRITQMIGIIRRTTTGVFYPLNHGDYNGVANDITMLADATNFYVVYGTTRTDCEVYATLQYVK
jgi:hypothetical protein